MTEAPQPELTADALRELLRDPDCPFSVIPTRHGGRLISLRDLVTFVRRRRGDEPGLEDKLDQLMTEISTDRLDFIDPWSWPLRMARKLIGLPNPRMVAYEIRDSSRGR